MAVRNSVDTTVSAHGIQVVNSSASGFTTPTLTNGQLLIGSTGAAPVASTLTASGGLTVTNGPGAITISNNASTFTKFTSSGTWTKKSSTAWVIIYCWGGGAGGGSGRRGAAGTVRTGGSGGGAGSFVWWQGPANVFNTTESVTIGAGGTGGAAQTVDNTNGIDGGEITDSSVGALFTNSMTNLGTGGKGGQAVTTSPRNRGGCYCIAGGQNGAFDAGGAGRNDGTGTTPTNIPDTSPPGGYSFYQIGAPGAGAGAGGITSGDLRGDGGTGQTIVAPGPYNSATVVVAGGIAGTVAAVDAGNGNTYPSTGGYFVGGSGGGGGAGGDPAGGVGGNGGNGGTPGGGGGAGGGSLNGFNSGAGGSGGQGEVWIIEL